MDPSPGVPVVLTVRSPSGGGGLGGPDSEADPLQPPDLRRRPLLHPCRRLG